MTIFRLIQVESICKRKNKCDSKIEFCFEKDRKHRGKRRKCWLPLFSQFFQKPSFLGLLKVWIVW